MPIIPSPREKVADSNSPRRHISSILAGLAILSPSLAEAKDPPTKNPSEKKIFEAQPNVTVIFNGTAHKAHLSNSNPQNQKTLEGSMQMAEGRLAVSTAKGVIPNGNINGYIAGGQYAGVPYLAGKISANLGRFGVDLGHSFDFTSMLLQAPHVRYDDGAKTKLDATYYQEAPLPLVFDRLAKVNVNVGPGQNPSMFQVFGGIRSGTGLMGKWNPTGVMGLNINSDFSSTGVIGNLDKDHRFYGEFFHRRVQQIKNLRWEMIAVMLATNYPYGDKEDKKLSVGSSVFNAFGFGPNVGGDMKRWNLYHRMDWGATGAEHRFNASLGATLIPFTKFQDVHLTPEVYLRGQAGSGKGVTGGGATLNLQVKF